MSNLITQPSFVGLEATNTKPDAFIHPVREFLDECGVDVSNFPYMKFRFEIPDRKQLRPHRVFMPISLPNNHGLLYESFFRVLRIVEVPDSALRRHRIFMDVEWLVLEQGVPEEQNHLAHHFLAREFVCPNCKDAFEPNLDKINSLALQIICPQCLYEWMIRIDPTTEGMPSTESLMELYKLEPALLREYLNDWSSHLKTFENAAFSAYFPVRFQPFEDFEADRLLRAFYSDDLIKVWKTEDDYQQLDFASIVRSFANHMAWNFFRKEENTSKLTTTVNTPFDQTEIKHKPEAFAPRESREKIRPASPLRVVPKVLEEYHPQPALSTRIKSLVYGSIIFGLTVGVMLMTVFFFIQPSLEINRHSETVSRIIPEPAPKLPEPAAVEIQPPAPAVELPAPEMKPEPKMEKKAEVKVTAPSLKAAKDKAALLNRIFRQGMLHLKLQQSKEAAASFKQVLAQDSKHLEAMRNLGLAYVYGQNFDEAIGTFEKYLKLSGNSLDRSSVEELLKTLKERRSAH